MSPTEEFLKNLQHEHIKMIIDGLELLDEYYTTESLFDKVMEVRDLKTTVQKHVPTHILN